MRIDSAHITNFKLLEDVELRFSKELARPLTVIRAENGSGKTSILQALRWGMWDDQGIPQGMALTSTSVAEDEPVSVQVRIDFSEHDRFSGEETRYRLIRSCLETRTEGDKFTRTEKRERLLRLTDRGAEEIDVGRTARIDAMMPLHLANVFFTDGDAVQNFVSGDGQSKEGRQEYVHQAVRQLLGFTEVELAEKFLRTVARNFQRELRSSGSEELNRAEDALREVEADLAKRQEERGRVLRNIEGVDQQIRDDEKELGRITGIGDLDTIQDRIRQLEDDIAHLEREEDNIREQMKNLLHSERLSRSMLWQHLQAGIDVLAELEDKNVIPGMSVGLLHDRLDLGICICGEDLAKGNARHKHVRELIEQQRQTQPRTRRLTELRYQAGTMTSLSESGGAIAEYLASLRTQFTDCKDQQRQKNADLGVELHRREQIKVERVQVLTQRLQSNRRKKSEFDRKRGEIEAMVHTLEEKLSQHQSMVDKAEKREQLSGALRRRSQFANDMHGLTSGILGRLKSDHVRRVSDRMNRLFLDIIGADTTAAANLFSSVDIVAEDYDIVVHAQADRTLDVVTDLHGAAKRVLTLSLIWALMEVAEKEAPRIIDSPLGMTSGAVKHRMLELLTSPVHSGGLPYQIILFMTRSEIRDIEDLIQSRAGVITTMSCSKDYPKDLVHDWGTGYPVSRMCECDHTQICWLCERRNDRGRMKHREVPA